MNCDVACAVSVTRSVDFLTSLAFPAAWWVFRGSVVSFVSGLSLFHFVFESAFMRLEFLASQFRESLLVDRLAVETFVTQRVSVVAA